MNTRRTHKFCVRYYHDGVWWGMLLDAYDMEDAEVRCRKLSLQLDGILLFALPGWLPFGGLLIDCICRVRNFFHNLTRP